MSSPRSRVLGASKLRLGAGLASGVTARATYFTRYSRLDALFGEIDVTLDAQMAPAEKAALVAAALLVAASLIGPISLLRRSRLRS